MWEELICSEDSQEFFEKSDTQSLILAIIHSKSVEKFNLYTAKIDYASLYYIRKVTSISLF